MEWNGIFSIFFVLHHDRLRANSRYLMLISFLILFTWNIKKHIKLFYFVLHQAVCYNFSTASITKYIIVFYLFQIFPISLWFAIIPILILMCALLAICNICWNYWHGKRPLTKISWFSTVSCRRTGKKNILDENYHGAYYA